MSTLPDLFPFEHATKGDFRVLLYQVASGDPAALLALDVHRGESPGGKLILLVSNSSPEARRVFADATHEVVLTSVEAFVAHPGEKSEFLLRILAVVEMALAAGIVEDLRKYVGPLRNAAEVNSAAVKIAAARLLSYSGSLESVAAIENIYDRGGKIQLLAGYLLTARSRSDALHAFDFDIEASSPNESGDEFEPAYALAVQSALWRMFERDGFLAQTKLQQLGDRWSGPLKALVLEVLRGPQLQASFPARKVVRQLSNSAADDETQIASGVAARVLKKRLLHVLAGFSMSSAEPAASHEIKLLWMIEFVQHVMRIAASRFRESIDTSGVLSLVEARFSRDVKVDWIDWPIDDPWRTTFDRMLLNNEERFPLERTIDVCLEMLYLNYIRSRDFQIIELGKLRKFSVLYEPRNEKVASYFSTTPEAERSLAGALKAWERIDERAVVPMIYTPSFTTANDMIMFEIDHVHWASNNWQLYWDADDLFNRFRDDQVRTVAICDNVTANDVLGRKPRSLDLKRDKLPYPTPIPIGIGFDVSDLAWGAVLDDALHSLIAEGRPDVIASLLSFAGDIVKIDGDPTGALAELFEREKGNARI